MCNCFVQSHTKVGAAFAYGVGRGGAYKTVRCAYVSNTIPQHASAMRSAVSKLTTEK